ncbi:FtsX-like permease family protein [Halomicrococcus sp. NG-SE-24]|uniref:FtsX-like permease family protein n=1 Tax=Halomicrococcus sp. NG-SE-24 TaxID=3436928 RepID=UPI003D95CE70
MNARSGLLGRWSRREKLAVLVIALTVAFLTGTTLVLSAASNQTTAIATEYTANGTATYYESPQEARERAATEQSAIVVPVANITQPDGSQTLAVGLPKQRSGAFQRTTGIPLGTPPATGVAAGTVHNQTVQQLQGRDATVTVSVTPRTEQSSVFPSQWYIANTSTVSTLGPTGAFVISATASPSQATGPQHGVPFQSVLLFFVQGAQSLVTLLTITSIGGGILTGVTVFSVTRMSVRDRLPTIRILRSTGASPRAVLRIFVVRAGTMTGVGLCLGYAFGVILTNTAVNVAVFAGLPTSLNVRVTAAVARQLAIVYSCIGGLSILSGVLAALPAVRRPPAQLQQTVARTQVGESGSLFGDSALFRLRLLDWRALVPSMATLAVFATVVILVGSLAGMLAPLLMGTGSTLTEPGAVHPVASSLPAQSADTLRENGIAASPEILVFSMHDGQPVVVRGVNYTAFEAVSEAELTQGHPPRQQRQAVVGDDLAKTLGLSVGDQITLGGSTDPGMTRVQIVGTYTAPGAVDDQLLVSLPVAQHLSTKRQGTVQFIRTKKPVDNLEMKGPTISVLGITAPEQVASNTSVPVHIRVQNFAPKPATRTLQVGLGNTTVTETVTLNASEQRTVTMRVPTSARGAQTLRVASHTQPVRVRSPQALQLRGVPSEAPPHSAPRVQVQTIQGTPVENATVRVGTDTVTSGPNGTVQLPLGAAGRTQIQVQYQNRSLTESIRVTPNSQRQLTARLQLSPPQPSIVTRPTATLIVRNPWNQTLSRTVQLTASGQSRTRTVTVAPRNQTTVTFQLGRQSPGSHTLRATTGGQALATANYTVTGSDRLVAAAASSGQQTGSTGIGRAVSTAFGNLNILFGVLIVLAGLMTIGSAAATFAQAIHARQRTLGVYRATGAPPRRLLRLVLGDAFKIASVAVIGATVLAFLATRLLAMMGYLTIYGVRIVPTLSPLTLAGLTIGGFAVMLVSAFLVTSVFIRTSPVNLLQSSSGQSQHHGEQGETESMPGDIGD